MAVQQAQGPWRTDLQRHDLSARGHEMIQNRVEIGPEAPQTYQAGEALIVPAEAVHAVRNVDGGNASELATYVVEKGKHFLVVVD
jgi:hypothetical protein